MNYAYLSKTYARDLAQRAQPITAQAPYGQALLMKTSFVVREPLVTLKKAELVVTAHGLYRPYLNGHLLDSNPLLPGWTSYEWRVRAQRIEIPLREGLWEDAEQSLSLLVGNGWYRGRFGFCEQLSNYGEKISAIAMLVLTHKNGQVTYIVTNPETWTIETSHVLENSLYNGTTMLAPDDLVAGWEVAHKSGIVPEDTLAPGTQLPVELDTTFDTTTIVDHEGPGIDTSLVLKPLATLTSPSGKTIIDFGQNLVGVVRVRFRSCAGQMLTVRYAEVLEHGELGTRPLRFAKATDRILVGQDGANHKNQDWYIPPFTFHGFRYVELTGDAVANIEAIEAVVYQSAMRQTLTLETSNKDLNQLVRNAQWSQRGNFLDIPTDCPQRDEREGWTGDIAVFAPTATQLFDCKEFLAKWLVDMRLEAESAGFVPMVVPDIVKLAPTENILEWIKAPTALWGDAAIWVPDALYVQYADKSLLAAHYPLMKLHIMSVLYRVDPVTDVWNREDFQFGDWLDPVAPPDEPWAAKADRYVIAQLCALRSLQIMVRTARILHFKEDKDFFKRELKRLRAGFYRQYVKMDVWGNIEVASDCQAVYALAIHFGALHEEHKAAAGQRLAELVAADGYHVSTGFAGTPYVLWALSETGHAREAWQMLMQKECPSWLYPVTMGATTMWERWDSMLPDASINPGDMTSFNHYAFGSVVDWLIKVAFGLRRAQGPGNSWYVEPLLLKDLYRDVPQMTLTYETETGPLTLSWNYEDGAVALKVEKPKNCEVTYRMPTVGEEKVKPGGQLLYIYDNQLE